MGGSKVDLNAGKADMSGLLHAMGIDTKEVMRNTTYQHVNSDAVSMLHNAYFEDQLVRNVTARTRNRRRLWI